MRKWFGWIGKFVDRTSKYDHKDKPIRFILISRKHDTPTGNTTSLSAMFPVRAKSGALKSSNHS